jgi:hypothetical protein
MRTWQHDECLLRRPQMEDSLGRGRRDAQGSGGPHLPREPLLRKALRKQGGAGRIARAPKKRPRSAPKLDDLAMKLLADDLEERPLATLRERCEYVEATTGLWVSRSTMCRAIARVGPTRKKGGE